MTADSFHAWAQAWERAMRRRGFRRARLEPALEATDDGPAVSYTWVADVDDLIDAWRERRQTDAAGWTEAHAVFVEVDALRPDYVRPSEALRDALGWTDVPDAEPPIDDDRALLDDYARRDG